MRRMAEILDAVALAPLVDGLFRDAEALRQNRRRLRARLDQGPYSGRRRGLLVEMNQHDRAPPWTSLRTNLAMNNADRRELM